MGAWEWELTGLDGVTVGLIRPREVKVTRHLNAASTVELQAEEVPALTTAALVRGWRAPSGGGPRALRVAAKVRNAMQLAAARDTLDSVTIQASDGYGALADRLVQFTQSYAATTPADIVTDLIVIQGLRSTAFDLGIEVASATAAGPPRDRTYEPGKNVAEAILQLAEIDDGFYFRVDPQEGPTYSGLMLLYPAPGVDSSASFQYGEGTAANLAAVQVDVRPPVNYALAFGSGSGDAQLVAIEYDDTSIDTYGIYDVSRSFSDVIEQDTLTQHARDMLRPNERRTFKVEVASSTDNGELATPSPWDDFDVGDTVALTIRTSAVTYTGRALVKSFTVTVDANGVERLSSLDFQEEE